MTLSPTRRRAERFDELLTAGGRTDDPALAPLAALAESLRAAPAVPGPAPQFRAALRQRLVAVAAVQGVGAPAPSGADRLRETGATWRFQRRMAVLAGGAAAATAIAGVGLGASRSLPGDPFYGVKRATEDVQLATTFGQEAKGKRHLEFARTRLSEVEALSARTDTLGTFLPGTAGALGPLSDEARTATIVSTLRDMDAETRAGASDLMAVFAESGDREPLRRPQRVHPGPVHRPAGGAARPACGRAVPGAGLAHAPHAGRHADRSPRHGRREPRRAGGDADPQRLARVAPAGQDVLAGRDADRPGRTEPELTRPRRADAVVVPAPVGPGDHPAGPDPERPAAVGAAADRRAPQRAAHAAGPHRPHRLTARPARTAPFGRIATFPVTSGLGRRCPVRTHQKSAPNTLSLADHLR